MSPKCFNPRTPCGVRLIMQRLPYRIYRFNPRTPCGATCSVEDVDRDESVSIHALLASATRLNQQSLNHESVSIHALLAECDSEKNNAGTKKKRTIRFNPRTPCGCDFHASFGDWAFIVSIHSLAECDTTLRFLLKRLGFQSTHSLRSATGADERIPVLGGVSITHSLRSATKGMKPVPRRRSFNHALACGVRQTAPALNAVLTRFQSHSLRSATCKRRNTMLLPSFNPHSLRSATCIVFT